MATYYVDLENGFDGIPDSTGRHSLSSTGMALDTTLKKFGTGAVYPSFAGAYLRSYLPHSDFDCFAPGVPATVECWYNHSTYANTPCLIQFSVSTTNRIAMYLNAGSLRLISGREAAAVDRIVGGNLTVSAWNHCALVWDGTTFQLFLNGVSQGTYTGTAYPQGFPMHMYIGWNPYPNSGSDNAFGRFDEICVTVGVARYTANFTPPTAPYSNTDPYWANIRFLYHCDSITATDGLSFATRKRQMTLLSPTAGDTVRVKASPDLLQTGLSSTWTYQSRSVALSAPVTAHIHEGEYFWRPGTNFTATLSVSNYQYAVNAPRSVLLTGTAAFTTGLIGHQIVAAACDAPAITNRAANLLGAAALTQVVSASADDVVLSVTLPFPVLINGSMVTAVTICSNSWLSFVTGIASTSGGSLTSPAYPSIHIGTADNSWQRVWYGSENGGTTFRIRYEGRNATSGTVGSPNIVWEITFDQANPGVIKIDIDANTYRTPSFSGITNGMGAYVAQFNNGTTSAGYTLTQNILGADLSAYQQLSFMFRSNVAWTDTGAVTIRLCSDLAGTVPLKTLYLPVNVTNVSGYWQGMVIDSGGPLPSGVKSVALYAERTGFGSTSNYVQISNIVATKAPGAVDCITHQTLIGKEHHLPWAASTSYALGKVRKPTQLNRTGYQYRATTAGTSGTVEPTWPEELGITVTDGSVVWTCDDLEETWFSIGAINGSELRIHNNTSDSPAASATRGYSGVTETVALLKREPSMAPYTDVTPITLSGRVGTDAAPIFISGGWNRTDMSSQVGETWMAQTTSATYMINLTSSTAYLVFDRISTKGGQYGFATGTGPVTVRFSHFNSASTAGFNAVGTSSLIKTFACQTNHNGGPGYTSGSYGSIHTPDRFSSDGNAQPGAQHANATYRQRISYTNSRVRNNLGEAFNCPGHTVELFNVRTAGNSAGTAAFIMYDLLAINCTFAEGVPVPQPVGGLSPEKMFRLHKFNGIADNHYTVFEHGMVRPATDQRHTAAGLAWKFSPTSLNCNSLQPLRIPLMKAVVTANTPTTIGVWVRRDSTTVFGKIVLPAAQLSGLPVELSTLCNPAVGTWVTYTLTFTPTESGVVQLYFQGWDGVSTTSSLWIDDITLS